MSQYSKNKMDSKIIHSLDKGLEVLELVATNGEDVGLSDLTQKLKWDKSTVFRLLTTLIRRGYIQQCPDTKRYRLGFEILHLEGQLFRTLDLPRLSRDILAGLVKATGEAAHLAALHQNQVIIIAQKESPERMAVNALVGTVEPLHATALGKAILMQMSEIARGKMVENIEYTAYTASTLITPRALVENVERSRSLGYAVDNEEFSPEVRCVAAPALLPRAPQLYALGISGPSSRVTSGRTQMIAEQVVRAAKEFAQLFGGGAGK